MRHILSLLVLATFLSGCADLPRDPESTTETVRGGTFRIGYLSAPGFVTLSAGRPSGPEVDLVREIADKLQVEPEFVPVTLDDGLRGLEERRYQMVIGGFCKDTAVKSRVALTRPYDQKKYVFLMPPGENGWLMRVDRTLHERLQ
jgi:ABC-type amino acid transport substrate-binding protein